MSSFNDPTWVGLLADIHKCGQDLTKYEGNVINLIASDNAYPRSLVDDAPYKGYMIQEGLLGKRPFAGADLHDRIETIASTAACKVFESEHANVQPHSCSQANQAAYHALLSKGDAVLALGFKAGGHLTHGLKLNFSGRAYNFTFYGTGQDGLIDYDRAAELAVQTQPKLLICGSSAYPRLFDAERLREIADSVNAKLMFDLSHEAGLIAGKVIPNPIPLADIATMSLDKTLRGPFGGTILCRKELAVAVDKAVHPGTQSSFSVRKISDAANALILTQDGEFQDYAKNVIINAKTLEHGFSHLPGSMLTGGTDKHYIVIDVKAAFGINGVNAEKRLEKIGILSSRQTLPTDTSARMADTNGLRLGTAWATSRGYRSADFNNISQIICTTLTLPEEKLDYTGLARSVIQLATQNRQNDVWAPR